jgi:simple sugar transport system ATP-binding protein
MSSDPLLQIRGLVKTFPGVRALDGVDFTLRRGEVHALLGENGAGKSTLIKVLTGVYPPTAGTFTLEGVAISPASPLAAQEVGISTVYQEVNLVPALSVAENLFLGRQPGRFGFVRWGAMRRMARAALRRLELDIDVGRSVGSLSIALQQMVAIARAVDVQAKVLILDEPTSSLDRGEVAQLFAVVRRLRDQGMGIVFVTHFLDQVYDVSDRITVLRNGTLVGEFETKSLPRLALVGHMIGRPASEVEHRPAEPTVAGDDRKPFLSARGLGHRGTIEPFDLDVYPGETLGLAGLLGSGRTEVARVLFGVDPATGGTLAIGGADVRLRTPRQAIGHRLAFCSEDRKVAGIIPDLSVRENIILALQARQGWLARVPPRRQREIADRFIQAMRIRTPDAEKAVKLLSGGNQQKVLLARWIITEPKLLILDEPTRGIDVGAKFEIAKLMEDLCRDGMAILFISSELEEVVRSCQRVAVLRDRRKVGELVGDQVSEAAIMTTIAAEG